MITCLPKKTFSSHLRRLTLASLTIALTSGRLLLAMFLLIGVAIAPLPAHAAGTGLSGPPGSLDPTFGNGGVVTTDMGSDDTIYGMAVQPDGKIVVAGTSRATNPSVSLARYNTDGGLDSTFGVGGKVIAPLTLTEYAAYAMALQSDGKIVVAGTSSADFLVARFNADGSPDNSFAGFDPYLIRNLGGNDIAKSMAIQNTVNGDRIVVAGNSGQDFVVARYFDGTVDTNFGEGTPTLPKGATITNLMGEDTGNGLAVQNDGRLVVAGTADGLGDSRYALARYDLAGFHNFSYIYSPPGGEGFDKYHHEAIAQQSDGGLVVAGFREFFTGGVDLTVVRYTSGLGRDTTFATNGEARADFGTQSDFGRAVAVQADDKIVVAGQSDNQIVLVRFNTNGSLDSSFDSDGKVTLAIPGTNAHAVAVQSDGKILVAGTSGGDFLVARYMGSCDGNGWAVADEAGLNSAIACYNAKTTPGSYTISLTQNIDLTASTVQVNNATTGVDLVIEGAGHAVNGQGTAGVRPFDIGANTTVTLNQLTVTGGYLTGVEIGGGIRNGGNLTVVESTIVGNRAEAIGGGIANVTGGNLTIRNSTVSGNQTFAHSGGIFNEGILTLDSVTMTDNQTGGAGALFIRGSSAVATIQNSILANTSGGTTNDCQTDSGGTVNDGGHNLVEAQSGCGFTDGVNGNIVGQDPLLGTLANNGGPTQTYELLSGSPAIDHGATLLNSDQRGLARPQGAAADIGAVEAFCYLSNWAVSNETELDVAIACYNGKTAPGDYTITVAQNINLTASSRVIDNGNNGVNLVIEGSGHAVDGQNIAGVRPFEIAANTSVTINDLTVSGGNMPGNQTGVAGGILNGGTLTLNRSTVSGNAAYAGGGIVNGGTLTLNQSTVAGNSAEFEGGGLFNDGGVVVIINATLSGNTATGTGGGLFNDGGVVNISNSTVSGNSSASGGGIENQGNGTVALHNSIIANSVGGDCQTSGSTVNAEYSLIEDGLTCVNGTNSNNLSGDPNLGPLQNNGGPTETHALLPGSIAINAGNNALAVDPSGNPLTTDQRGTGYPRIVGGTVDMGAYESASQPVTLTIVKQAIGGDGAFEIGSSADSEVLVPLFSLTTQAGTAQQTFSDLAAGFYELGENVPTGWQLTAAQCVGTAQGSVFVLPEGLLRFQASPGDNITCTFTNERTPSLTLVKTVTNDNGGTAAPADFTLTATGPTPISGAGGATSDGTFKAGTYTLSETNLAGYAAGSWSCVKNGGSPVTGSSITLAPGDSATCTINNNDVAPIPSGALTIGYWRNKNGQGIIKSGASTSGVCNSGTWLRQYAPFQDLSATATCTQVASYVSNVIKAATAKGAAMNAMLKAQMLATALDVYFSDPALGGNKIKAPAPIGGLLIDLTQICRMIDGSSSSTTCSSTYRDASSAFGGATQLTVAQILTYAASQSNVGGSVWYGQIKATQELAKDTFDVINNNLATIVTTLVAADASEDEATAAPKIFLPLVVR